MKVKKVTGVAAIATSLIGSSTFSFAKFAEGYKYYNDLRSVNAGIQNVGFEC
jgi:hypothetical protein